MEDLKTNQSLSQTMYSRHSEVPSLQLICFTTYCEESAAITKSRCIPSFQEVAPTVSVGEVVVCMESHLAHFSRPKMQELYSHLGELGLAALRNSELPSFQNVTPLRPIV